MLYSTYCRTLLLCTLLGTSAAQAAGALRAIQPRHDHDAAVDMPPVSDEHPHTPHHSHHSQPLVELNETEVSQSHAPDPLSYLAHDFDQDKDDDDEESGKNWRGLMGLHVFGMSFAFFVLLPASKYSGPSIP
jgi:hypothetical protein